ncbi:PspA/IM30 family protein [Trichocoleus sp. FACHB-69]|uniref:PspA/IM30 family protein n=1 Tax=Trichocoleus sp. FACHB-69 TaxID=2692874 RepID=UPI0016848825|nr:PspA/IM30 family protein [Trichocoleus sp. FACHB-69]
MGLFERISLNARANLNEALRKAEDPEKILEQSIIDMQEELVQLRQAVARAIATQKRTQKQYNQAQTEANNWQQRAHLAIQKGDENLAREALVRKKTHAETAATLKTTLDQQKAQVENLKRNLIALENKISEAKQQQDRLKARAQAAKANEQLQNTVGRLGTSSAMGAFERMEEKVLELEARSQVVTQQTPSSVETRLLKLEGELKAMKAQLLIQQTAIVNSLTLNSTALEEVRDMLQEVRSQSRMELATKDFLSQPTQELVSHNLEEQFAMLDGNDVDDEWEALKAQITGSFTTQVQLPPANPNTTFKSNSAVDNELEDLKKQLDNL